MATSVILAARTAHLQDILARLDVGANALVRWYDGSVPASVDAALSGNNTIVTFTLPDPCGSVSGETLTFDADPDIEATSVNVAPATASFLRILTSAGAPVIQQTIGIAGSGADHTVTTTTIAPSQVCRLTTLSVTAPNP